MLEKLKLKIRTVFQYFGYDFIKLTPKRKINKRYETETPLLIEFVGTSCVGKSTLYKGLKKKARRGWVFGDALYNSVVHDKKPTFLNDNSVYQYFAKQKIETILAKDYRDTDKLRELHVYYKSLLKDAVINHYSGKQTVILDEAIIKTSRPQTIEFFEQDQKLFSDFVKNRAVIYCFAPPEIIADRIIKRGKERDYTTPGNRNKTRRELIERQRHQLNVCDELITILEKHVPVLNVNTTDRKSENMKKTTHFIKRLERDYTGFTE